MKKVSKLIPIIGLFFAVNYFIGCGKEIRPALSSGMNDTLTSEIQYAGGVPEVQGFDFTEGRIRFEYAGQAGSVLDLAMEVQVNGTNFPIGGTFILPDNRPFIIDMGNAGLNDITEAPADGYVISLINISSNRSYCILTSEGKYAKIYVNDVVMDQREDGTPFIYIRFDWKFQPNGSRYFD